MYWPLLNMYSENFGFGPGGFYYKGYLYKSEEGIFHIVFVYEHKDSGLGVHGKGPWFGIVEVPLLLHAQHRRF